LYEFIIVYLAEIFLLVLPDAVLRQAVEGEPLALPLSRTPGHPITALHRVCLLRHANLDVVSVVRPPRDVRLLEREATDPFQHLLSAFKYY
jgi:hypothetical protein